MCYLQVLPPTQHHCSATALWTACELQPQDGSRDFSWLTAAIVFLETALKQNGQDINVGAECSRHLAPVYDLCYKRSGDRKDLDYAIECSGEALAMLDCPSPNCAPALFSLSKEQFERHKLTGAPADLKAAESSRDTAKELVGRVPGTKELKTDRNLNERHGFVHDA